MLSESPVKFEYGIAIKVAKFYNILLDNKKRVINGKQ